MFRFTICCLLGFTALVSGCTLVRPPPFFTGGTDGRIYGGNLADPGEYPSQIGILWNGDFFGAGNVISTKWALTAGHCVNGLALDELVFVAGTNNYQIGGSRHHLLRAVVYDGYNYTDSLVNDIAVVEVVEPFVFSQFLQPIRLPTIDLQVPTGSSVTVVGWGYTSEGIIPDELMEVSIEIQDQDMCAVIYQEFNCDVRPTQLCAGSSAPIGSCNGDSGGPLFAGDGVVVGLVSWANGCSNPDYPTVYTRVSFYRDWITQVTGV